MQRFVLALLFFAASCLGSSQAIDMGWDVKTDPPLNTRDSRQGKSVAMGFQGVIHFATEVSNAGGAFLSYIELQRANNDGVEQGSPVVLSNPSWHYTNPQIFCPNPESNDVTVIYERTHLTTGERWLAHAVVSADGSVLTDTAVSLVKSVGRVRYRPSERAVYAVTAEPYWDTYTYVRLYRFELGGVTMPVSHTHQAEEVPVDFTFDPAGDVYIASNSRYGTSSLWYGRIAKRLRTASGSWTFGWNREYLYSSTSSVTLGSITYSAANQRVVAGATYFASLYDGRPTAVFVNPDNTGAYWWWWSRPPDADYVDLSHVVAYNGRVRAAGLAMSGGSAYKRWFYMDLDENTSYAYWWYSYLGTAAKMNALVQSTYGEPLGAFADPSANGSDWMAAMPEPGVALNEVKYQLSEPLPTSLNSLVETSDGDFVGIGTIQRSSVLTRILLKPRAAEDTFENLKEGRTFTSYRSVLGNDNRTTGAKASLIGDGTTAEGGTVTFQEDGNFTYQPPADFSGTDSFSYKAFKVGRNRSLESNATIVSLIVVANQNPVAQDDTLSGIQSQDKVVPVLANDSDPESDPLHVESVSAPQHGSAWIDAGVVHYKALSTYAGADAFTYTISDDLGNTATATVYVNVLLKPVNLKSISPISAPVGSSDVTLSLTGSNFVRGSKVYAGETELAKTFISSTSLSATVPSSMLAAENSYAITVRNPNGAVSSAKYFKVIGVAQLRLVLTEVERSEGQLVVSLELRNIGTGSSKPQTVVASSLADSATGSSLPMDLGVISPGGKASFQLSFPNLPSGTLASLKVDIRNGPTIVKRFTKDVKVP